MTSKKERCKELILQMEGVLTREYVHFLITKLTWGASWGKPIVDVSVSTVIRALDELAEDGKLNKYMKYGHCYDYWRYKVKD